MFSFWATSGQWKKYQAIEFFMKEDTNTIVENPDKVREAEVIAGIPATSYSLRGGYRSRIERLRQTNSHLIEIFL